MTWAKLAAELYGIDARKAKKVAPGLAGANGSSVDEPVGAGARIVAPDFATVPLRAPAGAEAMGRFASYLGAENAHTLADAGFSSPEAFLYIDAQRDGRVTGVPPAVLERVRLQAGAVKAGVPRPTSPTPSQRWAPGTASRSSRALSPPASSRP